MQQHGGIGRHLDTRADFAELRRLLEYLAIDALPPQRGRDSQSADPGAHHRNAVPFRIHCFPHKPFSHRSLSAGIGYFSRQNSLMGYPTCRSARGK